MSSHFLTTIQDDPQAWFKRFIDINLPLPSEVVKKPNGGKWDVWVAYEDLPGDKVDDIMAAFRKARDESTPLKSL